MWVSKRVVLKIRVSFRVLFYQGAVLILGTEKGTLIQRTTLWESVGLKALG